MQFLSSRLGVPAYAELTIINITINYTYKYMYTKR